MSACPAGPPASPTATIFATATVTSLRTLTSLSVGVSSDAPSITRVTLTNPRGLPVTFSSVVPGSEEVFTSTILATFPALTVVSTPINTLFAPCETTTRSTSTTSTLSTSSSVPPVTVTSAPPRSTTTRIETVPFSSSTTLPSSSSSVAPTSTAISNASNRSSSTTPVGAIVGGVIGGIAILLLAFGIWYCLKKRRTDSGDDFDFAGDDAWDPAGGIMATGVSRRKTGGSRSRHSLKEGGMAMDGFSGAYSSGREKDLSSRRNDEQDDYYSSASRGGGGSMPPGAGTPAGAGLAAGAGMAGVGVLRREASSGRDTGSLSRQTSGRTELERRESDGGGDFYGGGMLDPTRGLMGGNDGGYGVASQLAPRQSNSYRQLQQQQQQQPQGMAYGNEPRRQYSNQFSNSSHRVSPPSASSHRVSPPSISPLPSPSIHATAYQAPLAARQYEQAQQQQQQAPIPRGDAASPTPSHRSLPGLNALWDTEEEPEPARGPLRAVNRESNDEDDFEQRRFAGAGAGGQQDAYSGLTAGLSR